MELVNKRSIFEILLVEMCLPFLIAFELLISSEFYLTGSIECQLKKNDFNFH